MSTVAEAKRWNFFRRIIKLLLLIALIALLVFLAGPKFGAIYTALTPPKMRAADTLAAPVPLEQGWSVATSEKFHSISQGTRTLPLPLAWLKALEAPKSSPLLVPFFKNKKFLHDDYILRFGFIKSDAHPHQLPLGFAVTPAQKLPGISDIEDAVGFTCAACHTSQITHGEHHFLVDGGPAITDLGRLTEALAAALGQTLVASKIPFFNGRFERFAKDVLGDAWSDAGVVQLAGELESLVKYLSSIPAGVEVIEGFARLDALNRIGNQSFAIDYNRPENYVPPNAPVNYPHIWTASWFDWVQYDGSIMAPLVRNAGEGLGVSAYLNLTAPHNEGRFSSSVDIKNLVWIEEALSGAAPHPTKTLTGLLSPKWPSELGEIDTGLAQQGHELYKEHCQSCHLPAVTDDAFWTKFSKVEYYDKDGQQQQTPEALLRVKTISLNQIGTDPAQADVLVDRRVNTAGNAGGTLDSSTWGMGLNTNVCVVEQTRYPHPKDVGYPSVEAGPYKEKYKSEKLVEARVTDGPNVLFAYALGAIVQQVNDKWFANNNIPEAHQKEYEAERPNCLRAGAGYKARPLNGVWATAPYLHNGAIATVDDLLGPPNERPDYVQLGTTRFDVEKMGVHQDSKLTKKATKRPHKRYIDGYFIVDTSLAGNSNRGHEFSNEWNADKKWDEQVKGVIGPALDEQKRKAIIEFLKTQ